MTSTIDPAITEALALEGSAKIASHGGSGFSSTYKITSTADGEEKLYFVKTGTGQGAEVMFAGEHVSLNAINSINPSFCPRSYGHGALSSSPGYFLVTDFLSLATSGYSSSSGLRSLATKLAALHSKLAPIPEGHSVPQFGFPVPTCCGSTEQVNKWSSDWADFYANNRLRAVLRAGEKRHGQDAQLASLVEVIASTVVPRLLREGHLKDSKTGENIRPVVVHGDLWSGNHGRGRIGKGVLEEVVFDPSSCYAHREYELGIMQLFGGFGSPFWEEYHALLGRDEPANEFDARISLYGLYHQLNHYTIFGSGYRDGAVEIMKRLNEQYGR